jgi:hypothetical protein
MIGSRRVGLNVEVDGEFDGVNADQWDSSRSYTELQLLKCRGSSESLGSVVGSKFGHGSKSQWVFCGEVGTFGREYENPFECSLGFTGACDNVHGH